MKWTLIIAGLSILLLAFAYALCRVGAMADLHSMAIDAARPKPPLEPWEQPVINGGVYDCTHDGSGL